MVKLINSIQHPLPLYMMRVNLLVVPALSLQLMIGDARHDGSSIVWLLSFLCLSSFLSTRGEVDVLASPVGLLALVLGLLGFSSFHRMAWSRKTVLWAYPWFLDRQFDHVMWVIQHKKYTIYNFRCYIFEQYSFCVILFILRLLKLTILGYAHDL